jgi:hypothetical protein
MNDPSSSSFPFSSIAFALTWSNRHIRETLVSLQFLNLGKTPWTRKQPSEGRYLTQTQNKHAQTSMH